MAGVWRRRRSLDTPRPAGRRWARLVRGGSRATQVFARVARRRRDPGLASAAAGTQVVLRRPERGTDRAGHRAAPRRGTDLGGATSVSYPSPQMELAASIEETLRRPPAPEPTGHDVPTTIPLLPGERTPLRQLKFAIVTGCTMASLVLGMAAVFLAINGELRLAALAILACVVFDGCDGGLARKFGVASPFGAQMDSLADLSSFGVATGVVSYLWLVGLGANPVAAGAVGALLAVSAAIRLARFNVSPKDGRFFCGVPTTMTAAVLALDILIGPDLPAWFQVGAVAIYAVAMVSAFPYAKLVKVLRLPLWVWVVPAICAMISVPGTFTAIVGGYLISGPLLWVLLRRRPALA